MQDRPGLLRWQCLESSTAFTGLQISHCIPQPMLRGTTCHEHFQSGVGAGGDSGGAEDYLEGTIMGIVGVQSDCRLNVATDVLPEMFTPFSPPPNNTCSG